MKTSNKILLGLFIIVFLIPVFIIMSFRSMIKKGQFTVIKDQPYMNDNLRSGNLKPYKVIKLVAPEGRMLKCNLKFSDSLYYRYYGNDGSGDSINIYNKADTLFVQYIKQSVKKGSDDDYNDNELQAELKLPSMEHIIMENAEATILSADTAKNNSMDIEVYGNGLFNMASTAENIDKRSETVSPYKIGQLSVKSINGRIHLGKAAEIGQLNLAVNGNTSITIEDGATIGEMKGSLSDSSTVKASWKYVKKLLPLTR